MPKTITLAMIALNEEAHLPRLFDSVLKYVDDLVVVDTGSTDGTKRVALAAGAKVLDFNAETHPAFFFLDDAATGSPPPHSGRMVLGDFGAARAHSFAGIPEGEFGFWLDADDVLTGGEHLREIAARMEAENIDIAWMKYNYGRDDRGRVACELWRERLVRAGKLKWVNPIHEVMIPLDPAGIRSFKAHSIVVEHHRPLERSAVVSHRNYKVLQRHIKRNPNDARTLFYFANEARTVSPPEAINAYERYVELSGWPEERCMARCYLGEMYEGAGLFGRAYACFSAATIDDPRMPDGWFGLGRLAYRNQNWAECVRLTEEGLKRGIPDTVIMTNPLARQVAPHMFYSVGLAGVGRTQEAHDSCLRALAIVPEEPTMGYNIQKFRRHLDEQVAAGEPGMYGPLSPQAREGIRLALGPHGPGDSPLPASDALLEAAALRLWKACLAGGDPARASELLAALPVSIREAPAIDAARARMLGIIAAVPAVGVADQRLATGQGGVMVRRLARVAQAAWDQPQSLTTQTARELRMELELAGMRVIDAFPDGDYLVGRADRKISADGSAVVIWTGPAVEPWTPLSPSRGGIGGSETACIEMARELAELGHHVVVYSDCAGAEGVYGGVEYRHHARFAGAKCDVFISSRQPSIIEAFVEAKVKLLWVHDVHVGQPDPNAHRWLLRYDRILCLSEWHRDLFLKTYPWVHETAVLVTRNGIDPARFAAAETFGAADGSIQKASPPIDLWGAQQLPAKQNRAFYSSSPNRGLDLLLDLWPRVRESVPDAELHVFYGFESWEATARLTGNQAELAEIERYKARLAATPGVTWRGRVRQAQLAQEMMACKLWAYPTWFTETYCITAVEAQAAGCLPVTTDLAALSETVKWGVLLPAPSSEAAYRDAFVRECIAALTDEPRRAAVAAEGRRWALTQSWAALAREWAAMFADLAGEVAAQPVPRYVAMLGKAAA